MEFSVLSYNIHKGFRFLSSKFVLDELKYSIVQSQADLVFLQEVVGEHKKLKTSNQFEHIADTIWHHYAYGKNAVSEVHHHGNAILSKYPIFSYENIDISTNRFERRGLLRAEIVLNENMPRLQVGCVHLNLFHKSRLTQTKQVVEHFQINSDLNHPLLLAGDFNDWNHGLSPALFDGLKLQETFNTHKGGFAKTFPNFLPILSLDRIYYRHLELLDCQTMTGSPWNKLSDHLPILARFKIIPHPQF